MWLLNAMKQYFGNHQYRTNWTFASFERSLIGANFDNLQPAVFLTSARGLEILYLFPSKGEKAGVESP